MQGSPVTRLLPPPQTPGGATSESLSSLASASLSVVPLQPSNFEDDLAKTMLCRLHQTMYQHMVACGMGKAAEVFLQESQFFPFFKAPNLNQELLKDTLVTSWSQYYCNKQTSVATQSPQRKDDEDAAQKNEKSLFYCRQPGCKSSFTTFANMKRHEKLHTGDKPFACDAEGCGKSFARKYDLKVHMRIHTKEKPYQCSVFGCTRRFSRVSALREHERSLHTAQEGAQEPSSKRQKADEEPSSSHEHKPGCGHTAVVHEGHADFLVPDAYGICRLQHCHRGITETHVLRESLAHPCVCAPITSPKHPPDHVHGPGCGHQAIQHEDHIDYIVDNVLHHPHGDHCDHHGELTVLPLFEDNWDGMLNCTWDYCSTTCGTDESCPNCRCRQDMSPPSLSHALEQAYLPSLRHN